MKNAYKILGVDQNATAIDIVKGQVNAMKTGKFTSTEIAIAKKQLSTPSQRLAVDFTFPIVSKPHVPVITTSIHHEQYNLDEIDLDAFNSLK